MFHVEQCRAPQLVSGLTVLARRAGWREIHPARVRLKIPYDLKADDGSPIPHLISSNHQNLENVKTLLVMKYSCRAPQLVG